MPEYAKIKGVLNRSDIAHSLIPLYKLGYLSFIEIDGWSEPSQTAKMGRCRRMIIHFN